MGLKYFLLLISNIYFKNYVLALNVESIIGGYIAYEGTLTYQVSIQWKYGNKYYDACGGAIIEEFFILSAAHCFIDLNGKFYKRIFSICAGAIDLQSSSCIRIDIEIIYLPGFDKLFNLYDIALVKLKLGLPIYSSKRFSTLALPAFKQQFSEILAIVSGFGHDWVIVEYNPVIKQYVRSKGSGIHLMKTATVRILAEKDCQKNYPIFNITNQMCGVMMTDRPNQVWGICQGDSGSPLVIDGVIVGIVSKNPTNCDDTILGCLYVKVSHFVKFIQKIVRGVVPNNTIILDAYKNL